MSEAPKTAQQLVDWLERGSPFPSVPGELFCAFLRASGYEDRIVSRVLPKLAAEPGSERLVAQVLREFRPDIERRLGSAGLDRPHSAHEPTGRFVHAILVGAVEYLTELADKELHFLYRASAVERRIFLHLTHWANQDASSARWERLAELYVKSAGETPPYSFPWHAAVARRIALRLVTDPNLDAVFRLYWEYWTDEGSVVSDLSHLSAHRARIAARSATAIADFRNRARAATIDPASSWSSVAAGALTLLDDARFFHTKVLDEVAPVIGWLVSEELTSRDLPADAASVAKALRRPRKQVEGSLTCEVAVLWSEIRKAIHYRASYGHAVQLAGVRSRLNELIESSPQAWAAWAPTLLERSNDVGRGVIDLLTTAAARHHTVRAVMSELARKGETAVTRDGAAGVLALVSGIDAPREEFLRWLADIAAVAFDGMPVFPHPLRSLASTWPGSADLDAEFATRIAQAVATFRGFAADQGTVAVEETLTGFLLGQLETVFRDARLRAAGAGTSTVDRLFSIKHRAVDKGSEEPQWGCDVALLLDVDVVPDVRLETAGLIQLKKSRAFGTPAGSPIRESWRIDIAQLRALLGRSESAAYWLICSSGDLLCVSARWLGGVIRGRGKSGQLSATVGYNDVRHAAIPMAQFLGELFLGAWIGDSREAAVAFARGDYVNARPRHIFEVSVVSERNSDRPDQSPRI
ncbi:hypothetical protein ABZ342_30765 [Amycolatopsis sp. NPDC005961]|uniref:hypothetical protein n=1 Tax=Amycolatopsis sp. NPDC005961 TaxID=3156720 RepID=UPI0033EE7CAB